jgi:HEPN domain-containing protein
VQRHLDWLKQAEHNLDRAKDALKDGAFDWACFAAQQAAEMAVKALLVSKGLEKRGHRITELLKIAKKQFQLEITNEIIDNALILDQHYITSRYVNSHTTGPPYIHFSLDLAKKAVLIAKEIIEICKGLLEGKK